MRRGSSRGAIFETKSGLGSELGAPRPARRQQCPPYTLLGRAHEVPGFAVGFVDSAGMGLGAEGEASGSFSNGKDEIGVVGNDVDDHEIYFGGLVGDDASAGVPGRADVVQAVDQAGGAFYLYAPELVAFGPAAADEDEVEALAVAIGLGDSETFAGGFVGEG